MHTGNCFDVSTYKNMLAGQLTAAEADKVCAHLEACDRCFQVVRKLPEDTLVASMRGQGNWPVSAVEPGFVRDLAQRILREKESRRDDLSGFVMFTCPGCGNKLKVKPELVGQKVKCPRCSQVLRIPVAAAAAVAASASTTKENLAAADTLPPRDVRSSAAVDAPTVPPVHPRTVAPVRKEDTNPANKPETAHDIDPMADQVLTDFLAPPQQPDEIGRLGMYRVLKVLGAGGMGVVYKAEDPGLKRLVAIKAMLPAIAASASAKMRFQREAQAAAAIKHNHIVTIFQVSEDRGVPFLAMEFLEGEPLDSRLKREGRLPMAEVMRIGREMAEGMAAAHERGLIHRDIKPANTWLEGKKGHVKILDFGLARATDDQANLTQSGAIIGTPAYMSPEQGRGEKLDARCDLWSLGVVLYCMSTGELPFKGTDTISTLMAVATTNPPPPAQVNAEVPAGLSDLVMRLLAKDPTERPVSARAVADRLEALERLPPALVGRDAPAERTSGPGAVRGRSGPRRGLPLVTTAALLILLPLAWFFGGTIVRIATNKGELIIQNDDPNIEVTIKGKTATIYDKVKDRRFVLTAGDYDVEVREEGDGGLRMAAKKVSIIRGGKETFHAHLELAQAKVPEPIDQETAASFEKAFGLPVGPWPRPRLPKETVESFKKEFGPLVYCEWDQEASQFFRPLVGVRQQPTDRGVPGFRFFGEIPASKLESIAVPFGLGIYAKTDGKGKVVQSLTDAEVKKIAALKKLVVLDVHHQVKVKDSNLKDLAALENLEVLNVTGNGITDAGLKELPRLKSFWGLSLDSTSVTDAGLKELRMIPNLRVLVLTNSQITDVGLKELAAAKNLTSLSIGYKVRQLTSGGLKELAILKQLSRVSLMGDTGIADEPVTDDHVKGLVELKGLTSLNLGCCNLTNAGLKDLAGLKSLRSLQFTASRLISDRKTTSGEYVLQPLNDGMNSPLNVLQTALPACEIFVDGQNIRDFRKK